MPKLRTFCSPELFILSAVARTVPCFSHAVVVIGNIGIKFVARTEFTRNNTVGNNISHISVNKLCDRSCTFILLFCIKADFFGKPVTPRKNDALSFTLIGKLRQHFPANNLIFGRRQFIENYNLVYPAQKFGAEIFLQLCIHKLLDFFLPLLYSETQFAFTFAYKRTSDVAGHYNYGISKIDCSAA